jgi:glucan 1,3-beta-glucosidase
VALGKSIYLWVRSLIVSYEIIANPPNRVNLGGWLVIEPFITPSLYEPFYPNAVDEWTLHTLIQARDGNLSAIENHYQTFITEEDFAQVAAAGLNWVRIPLPFWAIEVYPGEPFLPKVCWTYFLKAIEWARKYGLRINLDLHSVPGSQNGWNHSGKMGQIDLMNGVMGVANAQRTMDYIRILAEFISQPEYRNVVPFFGILNEPLSGAGGGFSKTAISEFYAEAYRVVRAASTSAGAGNGPYVSIHEAYWGVAEWAGFLSGADRLALDFHPYLCFQPLSAQAITSFPPQVCSEWSSMMSTSMTAFGLTGAGEWSLAINDCGLYVNQVGAGSRYEGTWAGNPVVGSCDQWTNYTSWDQSTKDSLKQLGAATMDALGNWFFWTWKVGPSLATGKIESPFWSYQLAIQEGWAVTDPRTSAGTCTGLGQTGYSFTGPLQPNQLGTGSSFSVPSLSTYAWPPDSIGGYDSPALAASLPTYTPNGAIPTLPIPTFTQSGSTPTNTANLGNGWNNPADQTLMAVPISGCTYPDPWNALNATIPTCA